MDFRSEGTRTNVNLSTFLLRSLKAERCNFWGKNRCGAGALLTWIPPLSFHHKEQSMANLNSFKIAQKNAFEAKGRLYTTGKLIQGLFIIDLYT